MKIEGNIFLLGFIIGCIGLLAISPEVSAAPIQETAQEAVQETAQEAGQEQGTAGASADTSTETANEGESAINPADSEAEFREARLQEIPGFILRTSEIERGGIIEAFAPSETSEQEAFVEEELRITNEAGDLFYVIPGLRIELPGFAPFVYFVQGISSTIPVGRYRMIRRTVPESAASETAVPESTSSSEVLGDYEFDLFSREFRLSVIPLNETVTAIRTDTSPQRYEQSDRLLELLETVNEDSRYILNSPNRIQPLEEVFYTSRFGDRREFVYSDGRVARSIHNGLDFRAPTGEPIYTPFSGRVVMTEERIITGGTVVLEHLPGVYSLYYHLETIGVNIGQTLATGDILGTVGSTGVSTGSHLHWEVRVRNVPVDPNIFLESILLDTERLIAILEE